VAKRLKANLLEYSRYTNLRHLVITYKLVNYIKISSPKPLSIKVIKI